MTVALLLALGKSFLFVLAAMLPILNPAATAPVFLSLTEGASPLTRRVLARRIAINAFWLMAGSMLVGSYVLDLFGISLPIVRIGNQQLKGYASRDWQTYLDAAGYPKQSALPKTYQWPAPTPLTVVPPKATASTPDAGANRAPVTPPQDPSSNPAGIQF